MSITAVTKYFSVNGVKKLLKNYSVNLICLEINNIAIYLIAHLNEKFAFTLGKNSFTDGLFV